MKNSSDTRNLSRLVWAVIFSFWFLVVGACPAFAVAVSVDALWSGLFDNSGQPLAGGFVYTYAAGTTTPKATYVDSAKSSSNTNPIQLDAYGRCNTCYADGAYKFVIKDADDVTLATIDNLEYVSSQNPSTLAVTNFSATGATLGSLTANVGVLTNMTISSATITLANLISPNIANASFTGVLYSPTINNATITTPNITGGTINSPTIATPTINSPTVASLTATGGTLTNVNLTGGTLAPATFSFPVTYSQATPTTSVQPANKGYVDAAVLDAVTPSVGQIYVSPATLTLQVTAFAISSSTYTTVPNSSLAVSNAGGVDPLVVDANISFSILAYGDADYAVFVADDSGNIYDGTLAKHQVDSTYAKIPIHLAFKASLASGTAKTFSVGIISSITDAAQNVYHYNTGGTLGAAWKYSLIGGN